MSAPIVGIDLTVTRVVAAALRDGALEEPVTRATECADAGTLLDQLADVVATAAGGRCAAVGLAVPGIVEHETGRVVSSPRPVVPATNGAVDLPLAGLPLRDVLGERLGVPAVVDNDVNAAALAESHDEALEPAVRHLVLLMVGSHIGGGVVLDGRIYRGARGGAGALGHTIVGMDLAGAVPGPMGFPQPGSLEFATAGHALDRLAAQAGLVNPESALRRLRDAGKPVLGSDVVRAALDGDRSAGRMIEIWGQRLGVGVANAINTFDPDEVVIGGDAALGGELVLAPARRVARGYALPELAARTTVRLTRHGERAVVAGAALLAAAEAET